MPAPVRCDHCASMVPAGNRFCPRCGGVVEWGGSTTEGVPPPKAFLLLHLPGGIVRKEALSSPVVRVGRGADCDIVVDHPRVSRHHATLELRDGQYHLSDSRSTGGTFLNDRPVHRPSPLRSGDTFRLGRLPEESVTLVYHEAG